MQGGLWDAGGFVDKKPILLDYLNHPTPYVCINKNPLITLVGFQGV